jgi:predicted lipid carrier protein YhbT
VIQDEAAFALLERETHGSFTALLGALAGLGAEMRLTRKRVIDLEAVNGVVLLEVTGRDGFRITTRFGAGSLAADPDASIRVDGEAYADLRAGRLDPQSAFLDGRIDVEGDMEKVMQLAFSAVSPD